MIRPFSLSPPIWKTEDDANSCFVSPRTEDCFASEMMDTLNRRAAGYGPIVVANSAYRQRAFASCI